MRPITTRASTRSSTPRASPSYFDTRTLGRADLVTPGKFIDVASPATHAWLTEQLADLLIEIREPRFERATVMTNNRRVTRTIATRLHEIDSYDGYPIMGLRYESKIGDFECWALWKRGNRLQNQVPQAITRYTPELVAAAELLNVEIAPASRPTGDPRGD